MTDHAVTILNLCSVNCSAKLRKCVTHFFDQSLNDIEREYKKYLPREKVAKKTMKSFQRYLQLFTPDKLPDEKCEEKRLQELRNFVDTVDKDCPYLEDLLQQIIKMQIHLVSKIRSSEKDTLDVVVPDKKQFCEKIICSNAYSVFHNVETYYKCYCKKDHSYVKDLIDGNTEGIINEHLSKAYESLFCKPITVPNEHKDCYSTNLETAIRDNKLKGVENEDREIPAFQLEDTTDKEFDASEEIREIEGAQLYASVDNPEGESGGKGPIDEGGGVLDINGEENDVLGELPSREVDEDDRSEDELLSQF